MSDTPTREQVQEALDWMNGNASIEAPLWASNSYVRRLADAARLWLEGPTDEMINRAAAALAATPILPHPKDKTPRQMFNRIAEAVLRAALEGEQ